MTAENIVSSSSDSDHAEQIEYYLMVIRDAVTDLRTEKDKTQGEMAARMYTSASSVSKYERGESEITFSWFFRACYALEVDGLHFLMNIIQRMTGMHHPE